MSDLRKIAAFWKKDGTKGEFYSGSLDPEAVKSALAGSETRLLLFPVRTKRPRGPDLELFCVPDDRRDQPAPVNTSARRESRADLDDPFEL